MRWFWFSLVLLKILIDPLLASVSQQALPEQAALKVLEPRRIFLFVGVDRFRDPGFPNLEFPQKDVNNFHQFVRTHNWSDQDQEIILTGAEASLANVLAALDTIERQNLSEQDLVLVYLSTHGTLDFSANRQLERYAVLFDTDFKRTRDKGLAIAYLENRLSRFRSQKKALILALCHSGSGKSALPYEVDAELKTMKGTYRKPLHEASTAMMVLSASSWGEPAREDRALKNDVYTHFLLDGLRSHDVNQDGAVSLFEAHEFARSRTYDFTRGAQTPAALVNIKGMDPLILKGRIEKSGWPLIFADSEAFRQLTLKINGKVKGTLWQPKQAEAGQVRVALLDPEHPDQPLLDHYVYLKPQDSYPVSSLLARRASFRLQTIASQLPVDLRFDGSEAARARTLGLGFSMQDILSTPLMARIEYQRLQEQLHKTIDFEETAVSLRGELVKLSLGFTQHITQNLQIESQVALESLHLQRQVSNLSYLDRTQNLRLLYPSLGFELHYLQILGPAFAGLGVSAYPWREKLVRVEERREPLLTATGRVILGLSL